MSDTLISSVLSPSANGFTPAAAGQKDSPEKVRAAATQFESLMIGQVLKTVHEDSDGGWLGTGDDKAASSATGMADDYFARSLASHGGLGLAQMISKSLEKRTAATAPED